MDRFLKRLYLSARLNSSDYNQRLGMGCDAHLGPVLVGYHLVWPFVHVQFGNSFPIALVRLSEKYIPWPLFSEMEDGGEGSQGSFVFSHAADEQESKDPSIASIKVSTYKVSRCRSL